MKLFKTTDINIVKYCQDVFRFELPSVRDVYGFVELGW